MKCPIFNLKECRWQSCSHYYQGCKLRTDSVWFLASIANTLEEVLTIIKEAKSEKAKII